MKRSLTLLLSLMLLFTTAFSYLPYAIAAEENDEEGQQEVYVIEEEAEIEEDIFTEEEFLQEEASEAETLIENEENVPEVTEINEDEILEDSEEGEAETNPYNVSVEEISEGDEKGILIKGDTDFLATLADRSYYDRALGEWHEGGSVSLYFNSKWYWIENEEYSPDMLIFDGENILIPEAILKGLHIENNTYDENGYLTFNAQDYDSFNVDFHELTIGCLSGEVKFEIDQDDDGVIIIESEDTNWLSNLTKYTVYNDQYKQTEYGSSIVFSNDDYSFRAENFINPYDFSNSIEYTDGQIRISYDLLINNSIPSGTVINYIDFSVYGYTEYYIRDENGIFTIEQGVKSVPEVVKLEEQENGDIFITSSDDDYLIALAAPYEQGKKSSEVRIAKDDSEFPDYVHFGNYNPNNSSLIYDDGKVIIRREQILNCMIENGTLEVYCEARGYDILYTTVTLKHALSKAPEGVEVTCTEDQIVISCENDPDWIENLYQYSVPNGNAIDRSYMVIYTNGDDNNPAARYEFGNYDGKTENSDFSLSSDGKSIVIGQDPIYSKRLVSGTYHFIIKARNYNQYNSWDYPDNETIDVVTTVKSDLPADIKVELVEDKGLVISASNSTWINGIITENDVPNTAYVKFKLRNSLDDKDYDYEFYAGSKYLGKDDKNIVIPMDFLSSYIISGNYYIVVGSYGYKNYFTPQPVYISGVLDVPYDLRVLQNENGDLQISTKNSAFLETLISKWEYDQSGDLQNSGSKIGIYALGDNYQDDQMLGNRISTGSAASGSLIGEYKNTVDEDQITEGNDGVIVVKELLRNDGITSSSYEVDLGLPGYISANSRVTLRLLKGISEMTAGETKTLDFGEGSIEWTSSDEEVASVENGVVTAISEGEVTISAVSEDGISDSITFTVSAQQEIDDPAVESNGDQMIIIRSSDSELLSGLIEFTYNDVYDPSQYKSGGSVRFISVDDDDVPDGRVNAFISNSIMNEAGYETVDESLCMLGDDVAILANTISRYSLSSGRYRVELKAADRDMITVYTQIDTFVLSYPENIEVSYDKTKGLIVSSQDTDWLDGISEYEYATPYDSFIWLLNEENGNGKFNGNFGKYTNDILRKDEYTIIIPINEIFVTRGFVEDDYGVTIKSYGYEKYKHDKTVHIEKNDEPAVEYTITFNANGGKGKMAKQTAISNVDIKLDPNLFTRATYRFEGWSTKKSGEVEYEDEGFINLSFEKKGSITLYAIWSPIKVEDITITGPSEVAAGKSITLKADVLPADANNKKITWTSDNSLVSVSS
ncbi:MAG: Ig-like domain-containing protein, partial [Erysipelotrichaceae bacterium]|nr:Ig-like domain-containing protein [Erysipelotrichaceae bacterium]